MGHWGMEGQGKEVGMWALVLPNFALAPEPFHSITSQQAESVCYAKALCYLYGSSSPRQWWGGIIFKEPFVVTK